ncbi:MAG: bacteriohemerythrin [Candidatus Sedimenticola sp. PURPLELP]
MPDFMQFNNRMSLGIAELDDEHKALVNLLNQLAEIIQTNRETTLSQQAREILADLALETKNHFRNEESCMERAGYTGLQEHHREHVMLCAELKIFLRELEEGSEQLDLALLQQLKHWLIGHIVTADKEFADFFHATNP